MNYSLLTVGGINRALVRSSYGQKIRSAAWQDEPSIIVLWWGLLYDPIQVRVDPGDRIEFFYDHEGQMCFESVWKAEKETSKAREEVG
jgi:hypothetical protein